MGGIGLQTELTGNRECGQSSRVGRINREKEKMGGGDVNAYSE